jgi:hypothetical protein
MTQKSTNKDKHKEIMNDWNYDAYCMLTSLSVWNFEKFKSLIFVVQSVNTTLTNCIEFVHFSWKFSVGICRGGASTVGSERYWYHSEEGKQ